MSQEKPRERSAAFVEEAGRRRAGLLAELLDFLRSNRKWWLMPIVVALLLMAALIVLSSTAAAPFIYTLF